MVGTDPRSAVDTLRTLDSNGEHRHLKLLRHVRRMAIQTPWPTVADFIDNDEAEMAGVETEDDIEALLSEH